MLRSSLDEWWCEPGDGDWCTCLEKYALCRGGMYHKVRLLRIMLRWEEQLRSEASLGQPKYDWESYHNRDSVVLGEVVIIRWPHGEIMRLRSGSIAADAARRIGLEGKLVLVNSQHVVPNTELKDGDLVEVSV